MKYNIKTTGNYVVLKPEVPELTLYEKKDLDSLFDQAIQKKGHLIIDLSDVQNIDSTALSIFLKYSKILSGSNSKIFVCNLSESISGLFQLTKIDYVIKIYNSLEDILSENK